MITTRFGSVDELVKEGVTGLFVPPKDPQALTRALERFYQDETFRKSLAQAGYALVRENFDLNKTVRNLASNFLPSHERTRPVLA